LANKKALVITNEFAKLKYHPSPRQREPQIQHGFDPTATSWHRANSWVVGLAQTKPHSQLGLRVWVSWETKLQWIGWQV